MQLNVLDDLAEAMKALDGKKNQNQKQTPNKQTTTNHKTNKKRQGDQLVSSAMSLT
jgi:hypothetical protein